jgi:esterase/lipase superfamily enzyme
MRVFALLLIWLLLLRPGIAAADGVAPSPKFFSGKVTPAPNVDASAYDVQLYVGDSSDKAKFASDAVLIGSTHTDANGDFVLIASDLPPNTALTIRARDVVSSTGGDSVLTPQSGDRQPLTNHIAIAAATQASPMFGIQKNFYAWQNMYFLTDRKPLGADFDNTASADDSLTFGTFDGQVALGPGQAVPGKCGIAADWHCDSKAVLNDDSYITALTTAASGPTVSNKLAQALTKPTGNTILLYVHGYNNTFDQGASTGARLSYLMEPTAHTTIIYSWPSEAQTLGYMQDFKNAGLSGTTNLVAVLDVLASLPSHPRIVLAAHSMGTYALATALDRWALLHPGATGTFDALITFAGDLDVHLWNLTYQQDVARVVKHIEFVVNANDQALRSSQCVTGDNVERVGQYTAWSPPPVHQFDATKFASTNGFGHGYLVSSTTVALHWNELTNVAPPTPATIAALQLLGWLHDGGGSYIDWDKISTATLCGLWNKVLT